MKSLKTELVALLTHSRSIRSIFLMNEKKYVEHNSIYEKHHRSAEIIIKKNLKTASTI